MKFDTSERSIYQHCVFDKRGVYIFLMFSYTDEEQPEYKHLMKLVRSIRSKFSADVRSLPPEKRREVLNSPLPEELGWKFSINCVLPPLPYSNDGSRRRANLKRRISTKAPLFFDELYERELSGRKDYFSGHGECDNIRIRATIKYINEYWEARMLADAGVTCAML